MDKVEMHGPITGRWPSNNERATHTVYPKRVMVVVGTFGSGLDFYGPFKDAIDANHWVKEHLVVGTNVRLERLYLVRKGT